MEDEALYMRPAGRPLAPVGDCVIPPRNEVIGSCPFGKAALLRYTVWQRSSTLLEQKVSSGHTACRSWKTCAMACLYFPPIWQCRQIPDSSK